MARSGKVATKELRNEEQRPKRTRKYVYKILIACEDENTEPKYFKKFYELFDALLPDKKSVYLLAEGTGRNSLGVVNAAIKFRSEARTMDNIEYDETWAVFDKDDLDLSPGNIRNFEDAFITAKKENVFIAYSNECFELWLLLHLQDVDCEKPIPRGKLYSMIGDIMKKKGENYIHGSDAVVSFVDKYGNEAVAIERAKCLDAHNVGRKPIEANPNTLVYRLVSHLRELYAYYSY